MSGPLISCAARGDVFVESRDWIRYALVHFHVLHGTTCIMGDTDEMSWPEPNHRQDDDGVEANNQENLYFCCILQKLLGNWVLRLECFHSVTLQKVRFFINAAVLHYCLLLANLQYISC